MKNIELLKQFMHNHGVVLSNDDSILELMKIYTNPVAFLTRDQIVNEELITSGLLNECYGKYTYSELTIEIFSDAINRHIEISGPSVVRRTKREISKDMTEYQNLALELIDNKIKIKEINHNRSNINIVFEKRSNGLGLIEIRNQGIFRLCVRNASQELDHILISYGATVKSGANQDYYDFESSIDNLKIVVFIVLNYFYKV